MHGMCLQEQKGTEAVAAQTNPFLEMDVPDSHLHDLCNEIQLIDLAVHRVLEPPGAGRSGATKEVMMG